MPRVARRGEFYPPVPYNDGTPVEVERFDRIGRELVARFGGVTSIQRQFPLRGTWRGERQTYLDLVVVLSVIGLSGEDASAYLASYKESLRERFRQEEVLITMQELTVL